jgi:hypothetical protein
MITPHPCKTISTIGVTYCMKILPEKKQKKKTIVTKKWSKLALIRISCESPLSSSMAQWFFLFCKSKQCLQVQAVSSVFRHSKWVTSRHCYILSLLQANVLSILIISLYGNKIVFLKIRDHSNSIKIK